jgi:hypothetical protein
LFYQETLEGLVFLLEETLVLHYCFLNRLSFNSTLGNDVLVSIDDPQELILCLALQFELSLKQFSLNLAIIELDLQ